MRRGSQGSQLRMHVGKKRAKTEPYCEYRSSSEDSSQSREVGRSKLTPRYRNSIGMELIIPEDKEVTNQRDAIRAQLLTLFNFPDGFSKKIKLKELQNVITDHLLKHEGLIFYVSTYENVS